MKNNLVRLVKYCEMIGIKLSSLRNYSEKKDYLEEASEQIALAVQKEVEQDFAVAFSYYHKGVDLLLQGVQGI